MDELLDGGLVQVDESGDMKLTKKGEEQAMGIAKESPHYMKKIFKSLEGKTVDKEEINVRDIPNIIEEVDSIKVSVYELYNIPENDDLRNYQLFCKLVEENKKVDSEATFAVMKQAKYFEIPENVNLMLQNTSNEIKKVRMPHYFTFMDFGINIYDCVFHSALITDLITISERLKIKDLPKKISVMTFFSSEEGTGWASFDLLKVQKDKYLKKLQEYIFNFVDFVNSEDVKLMFREKTEKNTQRRVARGKIPIPSHNKIYVVGYLAKYLKQLEAQELNTRFTHRFWVRGHFRRFWNKEKYHKLYDAFENGELKMDGKKNYQYDAEAVLRVWLYPYIKGDGILINKKYQLQ